MNSINFTSRFICILDYLEENCGINQKQFAEKLGVTPSHISKIKKGGTVSESLLKSICITFGFSENWIKTGEGDMFLKPPPPPTNLRYFQLKKSTGIAAAPTKEELERERAEVIAALSNVAGLDAAELIEVFIKLPRSKQKKILGNALEEFERQGEKGDGND